MRWTIYLIYCGLIIAGCARNAEHSVNPNTTLFRSEWTNGSRAKVTADLVALLRKGMTKEQVANILEYPSRQNDGITKNGDSEKWTFTINLGRILILTFEEDRLTNIDGG